MVRHRVSGLVLAAFCWTSAVGQEQDPRPVFTSHADLVVLHVNVFDRESDAVPDLPQDAFQVLEDGQPQAIALFAGADVPVAAGLVLDASSSMIARQTMLASGGAAFARAGRPEDELFTIHFNENVRFGLPEGMPFTSRATLLQAALARVRPGGKTALYDAVMAGLDHLELASHQKRILVVLSDGEDNASRHSEGEMLERAHASNAIVYTVSNANRRQGIGGNDRTLRRLAAAAGGVARFPGSDREVVEDLDRLAGNIRRGYVIGYVPATPSDGRYHRIQVLVRAPGHKNLRVRSRDGYRAR
jgi:Ca-activated chloride channel family protein